VGYLIAKYIILFLLTGLLGFLLGRWWVQREFDDVTESYRTLKDSRNDNEWQTLRAQLAKLDIGLRRIVAEEVAKVPKPDMPTIDTTPLTEGIAAVGAAVAAIPNQESPEPVSFDAVTSRLDRLQTSLRELDFPEAVELQPVNDRLAAIERRLEALLEKRESKPDAPEPQSEGPRLLKSALYGTKDDLKQISGVGPKLEGLLNQNGIYYFWQIADWTAKDVDTMDERLEVFRGRIKRDEWVSQAKSLAGQSKSIRPVV